jgi:ATP-dependent 26S proteasome regulatory subunit
LQRLEVFRGLCVLTTNLRDNIDDAFMRRIRFLVDFRFPAVAERIAIWQRVFPGDAPKAKLDFEALGRLNVSGGSIRNIALGASFLAAESKARVTMPLIFRAAVQEYEKTGRIMTDAERAGWPA